MRLPKVPKVARGLRFRLTLSYVAFFTLMLAGAGMVSRQFLASRLDENIRDVLNQEWAAMKGYLHIRMGKPDWIYDRGDEDEVYIVSRLKQVYMLADPNGKVIDWSAIYKSMGFDTPAEVRAVIARGSKEVTWRTRVTEDGVPFLLRSGVVYADDRLHDPFFVAIGRSLENNERVLGAFTRIYLGLMPVMIFGGGLLSWLLAGRALRPVTGVAQAAQRLTGSNLSLRIPTRGAGDELDYLIETFNRMTERLESSFQQIRQFSTDVSHELRTPLTAIRGQLEVALFTAKDPEHYRDAIVNALQDIERLSQIVRALLLLAQVESGQVALQRSRFDLSGTVRDIIDQFQIPAEERRVRLAADLPPECPVEMDRVQIERLISNLVSNGVKYAPAGGEVRVTLRPTRGAIEIVVADNGRGIAPQHLPHIFERFYRVPAQETDDERGLGLGLSFVHWIARAHGGRVSVESELNKGTRFTVWLPLTMPAPTAPEAIAEAGALSSRA